MIYGISYRSPYRNLNKISKISKYKQYKGVDANGKRNFENDIRWRGIFDI